MQNPCRELAKRMPVPVRVSALSMVTVPAYVPTRTVTLSPVVVAATEVETVV
jgi:hypothetical protein